MEGRVALVGHNSRIPGQSIFYTPTSLSIGYVSHISDKKV